MALSSGAIIGVSIGSAAVVVIILIVAALVCRRKLKQKDVADEKRKLEEEGFGSTGSRGSIVRRSRGTGYPEAENRRTQSTQTGPSMPGIAGVSPQGIVPMGIQPILTMPTYTNQGANPPQMVLVPVPLKTNVDNQLVLDYHALQRRNSDVTGGRPTVHPPLRRAKSTTMPRAQTIEEKRAVIQELQKSYPKKPIPALVITSTRDTEREEQYTDNWLQAQTRNNASPMITDPDETPSTSGTPDRGRHGDARGARRVSVQARASAPPNISSVTADIESIPESDLGEIDWNGRTRLSLSGMTSTQFGMVPQLGQTASNDPFPGQMIPRPQIRL